MHTREGSARPGSTLLALLRPLYYGCFSAARAGGETSPLDSFFGARARGGLNGCREASTISPEKLVSKPRGTTQFLRDNFSEAPRIAMLPVIWCQQHVRRGRVTVEDMGAFTAAAIAIEEIRAGLAHGWMVVTEGKLGPVGIVFQFFDL